MGFLPGGPDATEIAGWEYMPGGAVAGQHRGLVDSVDCAGCNAGSTAFRRVSTESGAGSERIECAAEKTRGGWSDDAGAGSRWHVVSGVCVDREGRGAAPSAGGDAAVG